MEIEELVLLFGLWALAFWQKDIVIYIASGVITMYTAGLFVDDYTVVAIFLAGFGIYQLILAVVAAATEGGSARGWSQFKGIYNQIKGLIGK